MIYILTLCTGNVCRSPLSAYLLTARLDSRIFVTDSAGISPLTGDQMPSEMLRIGDRFGLSAARAHRARVLTSEAIAKSDLIIGMTRRHRSAAVQLHPQAVRQAFTLREFAHVVSEIDQRLIQPATGRQQDIEVAVLETVMRMRGVIPRLSPDSLYDVEDPYGRSNQAFERSAKQIEEAVDQIGAFFDGIFTTHLNISQERYQRT